MSDSPSASARPIHRLLQRLIDTTDGALLDADAFETWRVEAGRAMVIFADEPDRYKETLDLAVIVPELAAARPGAFRVGLLTAAAARAVSARYGFTRWPALVMLRDGQYLGVIEGLRDWADYLQELDRLLAAAPTRPPIRLVANDAAPVCH